MSMIISNQQVASGQILPDFFRPILWSYDFNKIDLEKNKKAIILNTINYGDLRHWKWIAENYGNYAVREVIGGVSSTEFRSRALRLAGLIFSIKNFNDTPRGVK